MKKKIFFSLILVSFITITLFGVLVLFAINNSYTEKTVTHLKSLVHLAAGFDLSEKDYGVKAKRYAEKIGDDVRVTFVDKSGNVLGDSHVLSSYQNHKDRKEIIDAFLNGEGNSIRYSETDKKNTLYVAQKIDENTVIRFCVPLVDSFNFVLYSFPFILISLFISVILAFVLSKKISASLIKPLLEFSQAIHIKSKDFSEKSLSFQAKYDELLPIAKHFDLLGNDLKSYIYELKEENNKTNIILNKMREGIIILNTNEDVLLINKSAKKFMGIEHQTEDKNILFYTRNPLLNSSIEKALATKEPLVLNMKEGTLSKKALRFYISPIAKEEDDSVLQGVIILISDVTEILRAERIRSEFVANVSHELKTPVTSIKGFAELISNENTVDLSLIKGYSNTILKQSERLISLIDDILLLSEIESKTKDSDLAEMNISTVVKEVFAVLENQALQNEITLEFNHQDLYFKANRNSLFEIILNLTDNAIKYNKKGGKVAINLREDSHFAYIEVFDNGIGLEQSELSRIFERFYRVDKSRSKKSGGTGLGLSIVKHIAELYKGEIKIESKLGEFTRITLAFPK